MIKIDFPQASIAAWVEKAKGKTKAFAVEFIQDMNEAVVIDTPYKTGFLRGSWWSALNSEPTGAGAPDPSGGAAIARMNLTLAGLELGDVYQAQNGASYGPYLEYGTQHIRPRAFVRGVVDRAQAIGDAAALRVAQS